MTIADLKENWRKPNLNVELTAAAADDYTVWVNASGTDTDTTKFFQKGGDGQGYILRPDKEVQILSLLDGYGTELIVGNPITVAGGTAFSRYWGQPNFIKMVIRTLEATTSVKLLVV